MKAAEADLERTKTLLAQGVVTVRRVLEQVTAAASGARAQLTAARDNLSYAALRAPFAGRVAARRANLGDVVGAGTSPHRDRGRGRPGAAWRRSSPTSRRTPPARSEASRPMVDGQPEPAHRDGHRRRTVRGPDDPPLRGEGQPARRLRACARASSRACSSPASSARSPHLTVPATALFERGGLAGPLRRERRHGPPPLGGRRRPRRRHRRGPGRSGGGRARRPRPGRTRGRPPSSNGCDAGPQEGDRP